MTQIAQHGEELTLQKIQLFTSQEIPDDILANATFKRDHDIWRRALIDSMKTYVLGMPGERVIARWPLDWWQAVKERFAPKWYLAVWPVRWNGVNEARFEKVFLSVFPDKSTEYPPGDRMTLLHLPHVTPRA